MQIRGSRLFGCGLAGLLALGTACTAAEPPTSAQVTLSKLMIWDGERFAPNGKGWTSPDTKLDTFSVTDKEAHNGKHSIVFHGEGTGYVGGGWNMFGWWPPEAAIDIRHYKNLSFWMKVNAAPGKEPADTSIALVCASNRKKSNDVKIADYVKKIDDGKWHEVVIPTKDLLNKEFDPKTAWELDLTSYSQDARRYDIYFDEIGVDNRSED